MSKISVTILSDGKITTVVQGVKGAGCESLLEALTREIGQVIDDQATSEYWESEQDMQITDFI